MTNIQTTVYLYKSEFDMIVDATLKFPESETGGDLFGAFTHGGMPVIWLASGPGPHAQGDRTHFQQDTNFTSMWEQWLTRNFALQYIGSWHSHHRLGLQQPSAGDRAAAQSYARNHHRDKTTEIIVTIESGQVKLWPYFYPNAREESWVNSQLHMLDGTNTVRQYINTTHQLPEQIVRGPLPAAVETASAERDAAGEAADHIEIPSNIQDEVESITESIEDVDMDRTRQKLCIRVADVRGRLYDIHVDVRDLKVVEIDSVTADTLHSLDITEVVKRSRLSLDLQRQAGTLKALLDALGKLPDSVTPERALSQENALKTSVVGESETRFDILRVTILPFDEGANAKQFRVSIAMQGRQLFERFATAFAHLSFSGPYGPVQGQAGDLYEGIYTARNPKELLRTLGDLQRKMREVRFELFDGDGQRIGESGDEAGKHTKKEEFDAALKRWLRG